MFSFHFSNAACVFNKYCNPSQFPLRVQAVTCQCWMRHFQLSCCLATYTTPLYIHGDLWRSLFLLHFQLPNSMSTDLHFNSFQWFIIFPQESELQQYNFPSGYNTVSLKLKHKHIPFRANINTQQYAWKLYHIFLFFLMLASLFSSLDHVAQNCPWHHLTEFKV